MNYNLIKLNLILIILISILPCRSQNWGGLEETEKRIEKYRKADFFISIKDKNGNAVKDVDIQIDMKRHAFLFGAEVKAGLLYGPYANEKYKQTFLELFNGGVLASSLKWGPWNGEWDSTRFKTEEYIIPGNPFSRERTIGALKWLKDNHVYIRGTNMVWPNWRYMPLFLAPYKQNPDGLREVIVNHIKDIASTTKNYVDEWDVVNEPATHTEMMNLFGNEVMIEWLNTARKELPNHPLFINENDLLFNGRNMAQVEQNLKYLLQNKAPIDGLGIQGHMNKDTVVVADTIFQRINRLAKYGLILRITEFDHEGKSEENQAKFFHDFFTTVFSHPAIDGIYIWGFWEGSHWRPIRSLFRKDWSIKPNGQAFKDLVLKKWWTNCRGKSNAQGSFQGRGFLGQYEIKIKYKKTIINQTFDLGKDGHTLTFILP